MLIKVTGNNNISTMLLTPVHYFHGRNVTVHEIDGKRAFEVTDVEGSLLKTIIMAIFFFPSLLIGGLASLGSDPLDQKIVDAAKSKEYMVNDDLDERVFDLLLWCSYDKAAEHAANLKQGHSALDSLYFGTIDDGDLDLIV